MTTNPSKGWEEKIEGLINRHKNESCFIADSVEYDEVNMVRYVENSIVKSLVYSHIGMVKELNELKLFFSQEIESAKREERERIVKIIEKMQKIISKTKSLNDKDSVLFTLENAILLINFKDEKHGE